MVAERIESARQRSASWLRPRAAQESAITTLARPLCQNLVRELEAVPAYLSAADREAAEGLLYAARQRLAALDEADRAAEIERWQRPYLDIGDLANLGRAATESMLRQLANPPFELRPEEQRWQQSAMDNLTVRLDQLSIDDLVARIERLSQPMREALFQRLEPLMSAEQA